MFHSVPGNLSLESKHDALKVNVQLKGSQVVKVKVGSVEN